MNPIFIVIPTLEPELGESTMRLAKISSGFGLLDLSGVVVHDVGQAGFTRNANKGLRQVPKGHDVCLLNDDIEAFQYPWLKILQAFLYSSPSYGLAGPSGRSASPSRGGQIGEAGTQVVSHLPFWCVLIKAQLFEQQGLLDERFIHYSSDTWYCKLATMAGWKCLWVKAVYLWHQHQGSGLQYEWRAHDREVLVKVGREHGVSYSKSIPSAQR